MSQIMRMYVKKDKDLYNEWTTFLNRAKIKHEDCIDFTYGVFEDDKLVATGSIFKNVIKCVAVDKENSDTGTFNILISFLINEIIDNGYKNIYVYTKPSSVASFKYLGFKEIEFVDENLVFLERGINNFDCYLEKIKVFKKDSGKCSAIVMNANPFTKGHQHLIEYASLQADLVFVFVLSEDASLFPSDVRFNLVKNGTLHLNNVEVLKTENYMISKETFPAYFLKSDVSVIETQARLDAKIFKKIAEVLNITKRFVGYEHKCETTAIYNQVLKKVLEPEIDVEIIARKEVDGMIISATCVRDALMDNDLNLVKKLVPSTTFDYLMSDDGQSLINKLRKGGKSSGKF
ncbi:MAG: [citrate (pro-3S)-lyase] ligase [Anaerorhabdus sp.]